MEFELQKALIPLKQLAYGWAAAGPSHNSSSHSCSARAKRTLFSAKSARTLLCERLKLIINALFNALYFRNERVQQLCGSAGVGRGNTKVVDLNSHLQ